MDDLSRRDVFSPRGRHNRSDPRKTIAARSWIASRDTTSGAGSGFGSFAIIGVAIGGFVLFSIVFSILLCMFLRGRRKKQVALARKVSRVYPGGNMSMDCDPRVNPHMSYHGQGWPIGRQHMMPPGPGQFSRPFVTGPRILGSKSHTGRPGKYSRLSWSVRPRKSASLHIPAHRGVGICLSPITESPLSRSMSSPELSSGAGFGHPMPKSPLVYSETVSQPAACWQTTTSLKASPTSPQTVWSAFCVNTAPSPEMDAVEAAHRPSPKLRSMSENFRSLTNVVSSGLQHSASSGTSRSAKSRPISALLKFNAQEPGEVPDGPPPLLPPEIQALDSCERRQFSAEQRRSYVDDRSSVASTRSSVLFEDKAATMSRVRSVDGATLQLPSSQRTSRSSDNLSILDRDRDSSTWDIVPATGLTSPSKRRRQSLNRKKVNQGVFCHSPARCEVKSFTSEQAVIDGSNGSLSTLVGLGRRHSRHCSTDVFGNPESSSHRRSGDSTSSIGLVPAPPPSTPQDHEQDAPRRTSIDALSRASPVIITPKRTARSVRIPPRKDSALGEVSGKHGDPFRSNRPESGGDRPPSVKDEQMMFNWDPSMGVRDSRLVSAMRDSTMRRNLSKRQKCVRISKCAPTVLGHTHACSPMPEEPESEPRRSVSQPLVTPPNKRPNGARPLPRPLAIATFDPQVSPTPNRSSRLSDDYRDKDYSPTMSMFNYYNSPEERSSSPEEHSDPLVPPPPLPEPLHITSPRLSTTFTTTDVLTDPRPKRTPVRKPRVASLVLPAETLASFPRVPRTTPPHPTIRPAKGSPPSSGSSASSWRSKRKPAATSPGSPLATPHPAATSKPFIPRGPRQRAISVIRGPRTPPFQRHPRSSSLKAEASPQELRDLHRSILTLRRMNSQISEGGSSSGEPSPLGGSHQRGSSQYYWKLGQTSADRMKAVMSPVASATTTPASTARSSGPRSPVSPTVKGGVGLHTFRFQASRSPGTPVRRSSSRLSTVQYSTPETPPMKLQLQMHVQVPREVYAVRDSQNFAMPCPRSGGDIKGLRGGKGGWVDEVDELCEEEEGEEEGKDRREDRSLYDRDGFLRS